MLRHTAVTKKFAHTRLRARLGEALVGSDGPTTVHVLEASLSTCTRCVSRNSCSNIGPISSNKKPTNQNSEPVSVISRLIDSTREL